MGASQIDKAWAKLANPCKNRFLSLFKKLAISRDIMDPDELGTGGNTGEK